MNEQLKMEAVVNRTFKVYGYCRVSTDMQANSIEVQKQKIESIARFKYDPHGEVDEFFIDEDVSGSVDMASRPAGSDLLSKMQKGDVVIIAKMDRMFRDARNAMNVTAEFQNLGVALVIGGEMETIDTSSYIGKFLFTVLAAVAELERALIRERILEAKNSLKSKGRFLGGRVPWGKKVVNKGSEEVPTLYLEEEEWYPAAEEMLLSLLAEQAGSREIASILSDAFSPISHTAVRRMAKQLDKAEAA